ncbi:MAG: permease [Planctomycetaceae bacterium]|nr:permease [Planctomycetaceae bacterium]
MTLGLISRYIGWELIKAFVLTLVGITLLLLIILLTQRAIQEGLGPVPVLRLIPYLLPDVLRMAIPATMLMATCLVYGRMSGANEIVALKANGTSPMVAIWPAIILSFLVSLVSVWLNDVAVTWGRRGVDRVVLQSFEDIAYGMLRTQRAFSTSSLSIHVKDVQGDTLIRPTISIHNKESSPPVTLVAQKAHLNLNAENNQLKIILQDTQFDVGSDFHGEWPEQFEYELPLTSLANPNGEGNRPSDTALREIETKITHQLSNIQVLKQTLASEAGFQLLTGDLMGLTGAGWKNNAEELRVAHYALNRYEAEPYRRWANGFSCLAFVLIGAIYAIRRRISDFWTCFATVFFPIVLFYYPVFQFGVNKAKAGELPPYSVWMGNVFFFVVGLLLIQRLIKK